MTSNNLVVILRHRNNLVAEFTQGEKPEGRTNDKKSNRLISKIMTTLICTNGHIFNDNELVFPHYVLDDDYQDYMGDCPRCGANFGAGEIDELELDAVTWTDGSSSYIGRDGIIQYKEAA